MPNPKDTGFQALCHILVQGARENRRSYRVEGMGEKYVPSFHHIALRGDAHLATLMQKVADAKQALDDYILSKVEAR